MSLPASESVQNGDEHADEIGPSAVSSRARAGARRRVGGGEGFATELGYDGDVPCVFIDSGTGLDLLNAEDVTESDWRAASQALRFASDAEREAFLAGLDGTREPTVEARPLFLKGKFVLELHNELGGEHCFVLVENTGESTLATIRRTEEFGQVDIVWTPDIPVWEWARFRDELSLLNVDGWTHYPSTVSDGMSWALTYSDGVSSTSSSGQCAFPPDGASPYPKDPAFFRMLMSVERMLGRQLWGDSSSAAPAVPDPADAIEHLLLAGARQWASALQETGELPGSLKEADLEHGLLDALTAIGATAKYHDSWIDRQVHIKGLMADWPGPGALDLRLEIDGQACWVELKWAKTADALHNCLWDAGEIALALRDGHAQTGYLMAGAPAREWERTEPIRGTTSPLPSRLFNSTVFTDDALVRDYPTWWDGWHTENDRTFPSLLPTPIFSTIVGSVLVSAADGNDWLIKLARIQAPGSCKFDPHDALPNP